MVWAAPSLLTTSASYDYDGSAQVVAPTQIAPTAGTTHTPTARTAARIARSGPRESSGVVRLVADHFRAAKGRRSLPKHGKPNDTDVIDRGNGKGQIRDYGPDGTAKKDFDFGHDHGAGDPHAHDWIDGERQPGRPIRPGE